MFPAQGGCPKCTGSDTETVELSPRGTLWTWTIQGFPPKSPPFIGNDDPATFRPFGVGYVELPGQVKVESRLTVADPSQLSVGMEMELVLDPIGTDEEGNEIVTFAFAPVAPPTTRGGHVMNCPEFSERSERPEVRAAVRAACVATEPRRLACRERNE
jgi:uncharacterized OB-fold protein